MTIILSPDWLLGVSVDGEKSQSWHHWKEARLGNDWWTDLAGDDRENDDDIYDYDVDDRDDV